MHGHIKYPYPPHSGSLRGSKEKILRAMQYGYFLEQKNKFQVHAKTNDDPELNLKVVN